MSNETQDPFEAGKTPLDRDDMTSHPDNERKPTAYADRRHGENNPPDDLNPSDGKYLAG